MANRSFTDREWFTLPLPFRQQWWRETEFNSIAPSADLLDEARRLLSVEALESEQAQ